MSETVRRTVSDGIAVLTLDNPPVNALGHVLRAPLADALRAVEADPAVKAVVIACAGRTFVAGADITEFGKPPKAPSLADLIDQLEAMTKPVVAAIHGTALGGGLELALGCHYRVAVPSARIGLPEVKLGIIPGAGGTQRLPRAIGAEAALRAIVSGEPMAAAKALSLGAIDAVMEGEPAAIGTAFARDLVAAGRGPVRLRDRDDKLAAARADRAAFDALGAELTKRARGLEAPKACVEAVGHALDLPMDEGLAREREIFMRLVSGSQSKAQRHLFFAEREAAKVPDLPPGTKPRPVQKAAVIGAGTMGGGIAMCFANAGIPVTLIETSQEALDRGIGIIRKNYEATAAKGAIPQDAVATRMGLITPALSLQGAADADLVIEAVFESMALKKEIFGALDGIAKPGAILATNTSTLDVDVIAAATTRPQDVLGLHFFSPANVMRLLEIVRAKKTAPDVLATAIAVARAIGKVPAIVGVCYGFVGNRMLHARTAQSEQLLLEGALPHQVDAVLLRYGFPMGPFAMGDLAGLDVGWRIRQERGITAPVSDALAEAGRHGQKTLKGYYRYEPGNRTPLPDPEVETLIAAKSAEAGFPRRDISDQEILERLLYPMINEGARILSERIAMRPGDIDVIWAFGYGYPVGHGGPMHWADHVGLPVIRDRLAHYAAALKDDRLKPAPLLETLAAEGRGFASLTAADLA